MAEKMTLLPCPFCGSTDVETYPADRERSRWNVCCGNPGCVTRGDNDYLTQADSVAAWNRRHIDQPAQAVDVGLAERLRKRAWEERTIVANNARVAELLAPELALFNAREVYNIYATRMAIDHRDSAKMDAAFADDLEAAATALTRAIGNASTTK